MRVEINYSCSSFNILRSMYKVKRFSISRNKVAAGLVGAGLLSYPIGGIIGGIKGSMKDPKKIISDKEKEVSVNKQKLKELDNLKKQGKLKYDKEYNDWINESDYDDPASYNERLDRLKKSEKDLDTLKSKGVKGIRKDLIKKGFKSGSDKSVLIGVPLLASGAYIGSKGKK